ncbi:MAG: cytidine deaminase [Candidatus Wallbacteria bacterium]|nr:cytidine deaminase [Candidatus Wallbacteria bacterium]
MPSPKKGPTPATLKRLEACAWEVMERAYNPYSKFGVGAAILTEDGIVFSGCNVENAAYGHSICAERVALVKAVSEGYRTFAAILIVCSSGKPVAPCGACRQTLNEFAPDLRVIMAGRARKVTVSLRKLLPKSFGPEDLPDKPD